MDIDRHMILAYDDGQFTFRHVDFGASYAQMHALAKAINSFQTDKVKGVLLVTTETF